MAKAPGNDATLFGALAQVMMWPSTTITLAIGAIIGWRRGHARAMRVLSLALMAGSVNFFYSRLPGGAIQDWSAKLLWPCAYYVAFVGFPYFALTLPERLPLLRNGFVRGAFVIFSLAWLFFVTGLSTDRFGAHWPWPALVRPGTALSDFLELGTAAIAICAPWFAWKRSVGVERQRIAWIGACLGCIYVSIGVGGFLQDRGLSASGYVPLIENGIWLLASCGLGYATLRHRIFDFGFAVNRAAVYTVTTALLLIAFGLLEWAAEHLLQFDGREKNVILDAGLALGVFLAFHRVRDVVEHWIERILFHEWHAREAALRLYVRRAAHATAEAPLVESLVAALDRYTNAASCAVYLRSPSDGFVLASGSMVAAPPTIGDNSPGVLALRESDGPLSADDSAVIPDGELALAMRHRGDLDGFVVLGPKPDGDRYRPDECESLALAVQRVGLDLHALKVAALRAQVEILQSKNEALQTALTSIAAGSLRPTGD